MTATPDPPLLDSGDEAVITGQLGRRPRDVIGVSVRCLFGFPVVIETSPVMSDGSPNPTLLYVTCPALATGISGIEAGGGVRRFKEACAGDKDLRATVEAVATLYRARRRDLARGREAAARLEAGIGGPVTPERATCLHAYAAALLAARGGGPGAVGAVAGRIEEAWRSLYPGLDDPWCRDRRCARWAASVRRAVIDVGSVSVRLLVADVAGVSVEDLVRRAEVTRLGEGLRSGGPLSAAAKTRTARVVEGYVVEARSLDPRDIILVGTSATRDASDGGSFMEELGGRYGVRSRVLSGREEASFAYAGATIDTAAGSVVLDVGGGSTELIRAEDGGALDIVSLALGAGRATDRWVGGDPPAACEISAIREEAQRLFEPLRPRFGPRPGSGARGTPLVGVAGTVTTLACLDAGLQEYDRRAIHLRRLTADSVRRITGRLASMTTAERAAVPCVQSGRAEVIVGGAAVLLAAMETLGYDYLTVSERDLLDGLALRGTC